MLQTRCSAGLLPCQERRSWAKITSIVESWLEQRTLAWVADMTARHRLLPFNLFAKEGKAFQVSIRAQRDSRAIPTGCAGCRLAGACFNPRPA